MLSPSKCSKCSKRGGYRSNSANKPNERGSIHMESTEFLVQALIDAGDYIISHGPPEGDLMPDHPLYGVENAWNELMSGQSEDDKAKVSAILSGFMVEPVVSITLVSVFMHALMKGGWKPIEPASIPEAFFDTLEDIDMEWDDDTPKNNEKEGTS